MLLAGKELAVSIGTNASPAAQPQTPKRPIPRAMPPVQIGDLQEVIAYTYPFDGVHDVDQEYYRASLIAALGRHRIRLTEKTGSLFPSAVRRLQRIRNSYRLSRTATGRSLARWAHGAARALTKGPLFYPGHPVGQYVFRYRRFDLKVVLDSNDPGDITRPGLLDECDVYFKTNYRKDIDYPSKVFPLPNANPLVLRNLKLARSLRSSPQDCDLFGFFRVWGGKDEIEGIEHNVALFELLTSVKCRKHLEAYLVCGDVHGISRRLERIGVACRTEPMPLHQLWKMGARSRLHLVRHGMHDCIPWRMMDVMASGGCPVLDHPTSTTWPHPLLERNNYLHLNAPDARRVNRSEVAETVENWLRDPSLTEGIRSNNITYFEEFLKPLSLGNHICSVVTSVGEVG